ncbi:AAA family ATPase [Sporosarcina saromensis]|uniref:AAA family ATPase n=1 Tax=Sporosarcina saromensis TaxID=359365 RepID=A0ABU4G9P2_9BACL|nr:AAA family ATPase [Sporosarcina saromensis]MDW0113699.1 AAA family ATPase [Sporosarcina saromensis]
MDPNLRKLEEIKQSLNAKFYEREHEVEGILLALLARQHLLMIGPAGTAKSALSTELAKIIDGTNYFQWLLTPFSTPEEVFGPLSLKELEVGVYKRNTRNKMPEADLVFLDEIFKANSAILNSLLTLINERLFYNGDAPVETPLISVIGASNEYPEEGEGLEALFDRFFLRYEISYIEDEQNFLSMLKSEGKMEELPSMDLKELYQLQELTDNVHVPDEVFETLVTIRQALFDEGIRPSDRRFKQALCVLKAKAVLHQRNHVQLGDLSILENALWETLDQKETVCNVIRRYTTHSVERTLATIEREAEEIYDMAVRDHSAEAGMEAMEKLKVLVGELEQLKEDEPAEATKIIELSNKLTSLSKEVENSRVDEQYTDGTVDSTSEQNETEGVFFRM